MRSARAWGLCGRCLCASPDFYANCHFDQHADRNANPDPDANSHRDPDEPRSW